eukprot:scaffold126293_cov60-Phaeocystis_antarctica.AAC.1
MASYSACERAPSVGSRSTCAYSVEATPDPASLSPDDGGGGDGEGGGGEGDSAAATTLPDPASGTTLPDPASDSSRLAKTAETSRRRTAPRNCGILARCSRSRRLTSAKDSASQIVPRPKQLLAVGGRE